MKKQTRRIASVSMAIGILVLVLGLFIFFTSPDYSQVNLQIAKQASNAYEASAQIAHNNQTELYYRIGSMFCFGFGTVLSVFSFLAIIKIGKEGSSI